MQIAPNADLQQLARIMGPAAAPRDAYSLWLLLLQLGFSDTDQVGPDEWPGLCRRAVELADDRWDELTDDSRECADG